MPQASTSHFRVTATNTGTVVVLAAREYNRLSLVIQVETGTEACRLTFDGTTASATNGILLAAGSSLSWGFADGVPATAAIKAWSSGGAGVVNGVETYQ